MKGKSKMVCLLFIPSSVPWQDASRQLKSLICTIATKFVEHILQENTIKNIVVIYSLKLASKF